MKTDENIQRSAITRAYVLAGGQSRRLGQDKVFLKLDGVTLLERTVSACKEVFETVTIAAKDSAKFAACDCPVVRDWAGANGPLAGIIASLEDLRHGACFIVAVDFCDLNADTINSLVTNYNGEDYLGLRENNAPQPLCGIYSTATLERLKTVARTGKFGLKAALMTLNAKYLPVSTGQWRNINTPSDLAHGSWQ